MNAPTPKKLTPLQQEFVRLYTISPNATQAYITAGGRPKGASTAASRLLKQPHIRQAVEQAREERRRTQEVDAIYAKRYREWIMDQILEMARSLLPGAKRRRSITRTVAAVRVLDVAAKHLGVARKLPPRELQELEHLRRQSELRGEQQRIEDALFREAMREVDEQTQQAQYRMLRKIEEVRERHGFPMAGQVPQGNASLEIVHKNG